jgi:hypothetical protein
MVSTPDWIPINSENTPSPRKYDVVIPKQTGS